MVAEVGILAHAEESLRQIIGGAKNALADDEATAILNELDRLRGKVRAVADWLRYHANSEGGFVAELLARAPYDGPSSVPVTDGPTLVEIAAERDAAEQRASEQRQRAKEAEDACASLRSRVAEIERERDALRITPEAIR